MFKIRLAEGPSFFVEIALISLYAKHRGVGLNDQGVGSTGWVRGKEMGVLEQPKDSELFSELREEEERAFRSYFQKEEYGPQEIVFKEEELGDTLYIVERGLVCLMRNIAGDVDKPIFRAGPGTIFGEFSFLDRQERSATALAEEDSVFLCLKRDDFDAFIGKYPKTGMKVYRNLLRIIVRRLRRTNEAYRQSLKWNLEITGTHKINFQYLVTEEIPVRIELVSNKILEGKVIQLEKSDAGYEVLLVDRMGQVLMVPYHAIVSVWNPTP